MNMLLTKPTNVKWIANPPTVDPTTLRVRRDVVAGGLGELPVSW